MSPDSGNTVETEQRELLSLDWGGEEGVAPERVIEEMTLNKV